MKLYKFQLALPELQNLLELYPNTGNSRDVGKLAVEVVRKYFLLIDTKSVFKDGKDGADLEVTYLGITEQFEIKGTTDIDIAWGKLKVSGTKCHNALVDGMTLIRVSNIGETIMTLYFMKYGEDFILTPEPRWRVARVK